MPEVTIPTGQNRDGWIVLSVNGNVQWVKAGVPTTELDETELEVLGHAGINYNIIDGDGNEVEPLIFADFKNGVYMLEGEAVTFDDLFAEDAAFAAFDPSNIVPGTGFYVDPEAPVTSGLLLKPSVMSLLADGATVVPYTSAALLNAWSWMTEMPAFDPSIGASMTWTDNTAAYNGFGYNSEQIVDESITDENGHRFAVNLSRTRIAASVDGRDVLAVNIIDPGDLPSAGFYVDYGTLETIGYYPLQDEADLPGLSALS